MNKTLDTFYLVSPHTDRGHFNSWIEQISLALISKGHGLSIKTTEEILSNHHLNPKVKKMLFARKFGRVVYSSIESIGSRFCWKSKKKVCKRDKLIHMYLDDILEKENMITILNSQFNEIFGFLAEPTEQKVNRLRLFDNLQGVGVFSEQMRSRIHHLSEKTFPAPIFVFNDFALSGGIGKPVVEKKRILLIGDITERKNLDKFLRLSLLDNDPQNEWRIVGQIDESAISSWAKDEIAKVGRHGSRNLVIVNKYVEESEFISEIAAAALVFIVYENWTSGSNVLTNAIYQRTPVLVNADSSLASIVLANNAGLTVGNEELLITLERIQNFLQNPVEVNPTPSYINQYSKESFNRTLFTMLKVQES